MAAPNLPPPPRHPVPDHIPAELREAFATVAGRALSSHCPYKLGDPVRRHGYAGDPTPGFAQTGFCGWVVATVGATILTGITTTGEEWWEEWGCLEPDGQPIDPWGHCSCCATQRLELRRAMRAARERRGEQLGLFAA